MPDAFNPQAVARIITAASPATSGASFTTRTGDGAKFPTKFPFNVVIHQPGTRPPATNGEIVRVSDITSDVWTVRRNQEGTAVRSMAVGDLVSMVALESHFTDITPQDVSGVSVDRWRGHSDFIGQAALTTTGTYIDYPNNIILSRSASPAGLAADPTGTEQLSSHAVLGVASLICSTAVAPSYSVIQGTPFAWDNTQVYRFATRLRIPTLSTVGQNFVVRAGFAPSATAAPTDGAYFEAQAGGSGTNWRCINRLASTSSDGDSTVAQSTSTYFNLVIRYDAQMVRYYVGAGAAEPTLRITENANRPAGAILYPQVGIYKGTGTTTGSTVNVDLLEVNIPLVRGLTVRA